MVNNLIEKSYEVAYGPIEQRLGACKSGRYIVNAGSIKEAGEKVTEMYKSACQGGNNWVTVTTDFGSHKEAEIKNKVLNFKAVIKPLTEEEAVKIKSVNINTGSKAEDAVAEIICAGLVIGAGVKFVKWLFK